MRKNIYKWHRTLSLIIALPVVLWAASGFMHPIMTNVRPKLAQQWYAAPALDSNRLIISIGEALEKNHITAVNTLRIVQISGNYFYQLRLPGQPVLQYISTQSGNLLKDGDALYARWLAKIFLTGSKKDSVNHKVLLASLDKTTVASVTADAGKEVIPTHDCCINAAAAVMNDSKDAAVNSVQLLQRYDDEYKNINRLLPVYKVSFGRADGIRIYVETAQDRFGLAMDNKRAVFDKIFMLFHTMSWLEGLGRAKLAIEISIMLAAFLTTVMGIYIFFISKGKKVAGNKLTKARWNHRYTSIIASLFTLLFTFSGAYHAFEKFTPDTRDRYFIENTFNSSELQLDWAKLWSAIKTGDEISNISPVRISNQQYWQVWHSSKKPNAANSIKNPAADFVKAMETAVPNTIYVNASDYSLLQNGEAIYARWLASRFSGHPDAAVKKVTAVTKFEDEYGFVNKRLPVWKISYATNDNERYYVETLTGKLSVRVDDSDLREGYSFSLLHKHHFMDFAGKTWRDFSTMFWAAMQIAMVVIGLFLYRRYKKRSTVLKER